MDTNDENLKLKIENSKLQNILNSQQKLLETFRNNFLATISSIETELTKHLYNKFYKILNTVQENHEREIGKLLESNQKYLETINDISKELLLSKKINQKLLDDTKHSSKNFVEAILDSINKVGAINPNYKSHIKLANKNNKPQGHQR
jgi:hypothetical protein